MEFTVIAVAFNEGLTVVTGKKSHHLISKLKEETVWGDIDEMLYDIHPDIEINEVEDLEKVLGEWNFTLRAEGMVIKIEDITTPQEIFIKRNETVK